MDREEFIASPPPIARELMTIFSRADLAVIFDVGSCEGEDAIRYTRLFPNATVYAFEPLARNMELMRSSLERHGATRVVPVQLALSDSSGEAEMWVSSGRPADADPALDWDYGNKSSSLLEPEQHLRIHPWVRFERTEVVRTETIEGFARQAGISVIDFAHLDVQGAELKVLRGAGTLLEGMKAVWLEVASVPLYGGQPLRPEVETFMHEHGFQKVRDAGDEISGDQLYVGPTIPDETIEALRSYTSSSPLRTLVQFLRDVKRVMNASDTGAYARVPGQG